MVESVRLVIWDLDETFWRGTLTEGGIGEYIQAHHDIVVQLARRGIMSSICSKNDPAEVLPILQARGILEFFVFNSISWEPKGARIAALIESVQLRPSTVMFIDDNPSNRAEAAAFVPDLQVETEQFIPTMLADPRFAGKDDSKLIRLSQYKLLETRKRDETASGGNEDFLRSCDIRVSIEFDVLANIDRAIELINRTNQLNFTKKRLPENLDQARIILAQDLKDFARQAGLVRVIDRYGDYGFIGFFMVEYLRESVDENAACSNLIHYCFSCRTLGMLIEHYIYQYLRRPEIKVVGNVLTDLSVSRDIDWVTIVPALEAMTGDRQQVAAEIVVWGGCEAEAVGFYLNTCTPRIRVFSNYAFDGMFARINSAIQVLQTCDRDPADFAKEAEILGLPLHVTATNFIADAAPGAVFVLNCSRDAGTVHYYKHKTKGWIIHLEPRAFARINLVTESEKNLLDAIERTTSSNPEQRASLLRVCQHVRENYDNFLVNERFRDDTMRKLIARIPVGAKLVIAVDHDEVRINPTKIEHYPLLTRYAEKMRELASRFPFVGVVCYSDVIHTTSEIQVGGNHYDRPVYHRFANSVVEMIDALKPREAEPVMELAEAAS